MRSLQLAILLLFIPAYLAGQNLVGLSSGEVKNYFSSNYPDLVLESGINNDSYNYLKFSDYSAGLVTVLAFLDEKDNCYHMRYIYDLGLEPEVLEYLNDNYSSAGDCRWEDKSENGVVGIYYKKEEWFITVNYKEE